MAKLPPEKKYRLKAILITLQTKFSSYLKCGTISNIMIFPYVGIISSAFFLEQLEAIF